MTGRSNGKGPLLQRGLKPRASGRGPTRSPFFVDEGLSLDDTAAVCQCRVTGWTSWVPDSPRFGRVEILTLFSIIEQAQESIQYKNRTLANSARMRHTSLKITRGVAFGHPNNLLALQSVAHPANHSSGILSSTVSVKRIECGPGRLVPAVQLTRKQRTLVDEIHHIFP
jgi:hypothetical protein